MYAAKVRNGFVPHTRREVAAKLKGLQMTPAPSSTYQRKSGRNGHSHEKKRKTAYGSSQRWSCKSSSGNGFQTATEDTQNLLDCERTKTRIAIFGHQVFVMRRHETVTYKVLPVNRCTYSLADHGEYFTG